MNAGAPGEEASLRGLLEIAWRMRRRMMGVGGFVVLAFTAAAVFLPPRYVSRSTLVLLLGSEYTVRAPAGAGPASNTSFDADHILGTETEILASVDLHRDVVRTIGVARLYPKLLLPPILPLRVIGAIRRLPDTLAQWAGSAPARHDAVDPTEEAAEILGDKLQIKPSKLANVIGLGFPHRDPLVARETLRAVERLYLQRRRALYLRQDSRAMRADVVRARMALDAADAALATFRQAHALPDYATQLASLLRAQADIDQDAIAARRDAAAGQARIAELELERSRLSPMVTGGSDTSLDAHTAALRDGIEVLRAREAATLSRYRTESANARDIEAQIATRDDELAHAMPRSLSATHEVRNSTYDGVIGNLVSLRAAQRGFDSRLDDDDSEAVAVSRRIADLGEHQREFDALTTRRDVLLDDFKRLEADASAQADMEAVEAASLPSVRIASAPSLPMRPVPIRLLLIVAGMMLAVMAAAAGCLLAHATRRTILHGDELASLGVALLGRVPVGDPMVGAGPIVPVGV